jgi:hypothetical protein
MRRALAAIGCVGGLLLATHAAQALQSILTAQTIATDAQCTAGVRPWGGGPEAGNHYIYVAYMTDDGGCNSGTHEHRVLRYDYRDGAWTISSLIASTDPSSSDEVDAPIIFRAASGSLFVFYGAQTARNGNCVGDNNGPFYKVSTTPDDVSAWGAEQRVPVNGSMAGAAGGFTTNGDLHLVGQQRATCGTIQAGDMPYARRASDGTWTVSDLIHNDDDGADDGDPGCNADLTVKGAVLHLVWTEAIGDCVGTYNDIYYARSTDNGDTWVALNGTTSFTAGSGLAGTHNGARYVFPSGYRAVSGAITTGLQVDTLGDGSVILAWQDGAAIKAQRSSGTEWCPPVVVDPIAGAGVGLAMAVIGNRIVIHATDLVDVYEFVSRDQGETWVKTTIYTKGAEASTRYPLSRVFRNLGGGARLLLLWTKSFADPTASQLGFYDRPQAVLQDVVTTGGVVPRPR